MSLICLYHIQISVCKNMTEPSITALFSRWGSTEDILIVTDFIFILWNSYFSFYLFEYNSEFDVNLFFVMEINAKL